MTHISQERLAQWNGCCASFNHQVAVVHKRGFHIQTASLGRRAGLGRSLPGLLFGTLNHLRTVCSKETACQTRSIEKSWWYLGFLSFLPEGRIEKTAVAKVELPTSLAPLVHPSRSLHSRPHSMKDLKFWERHKLNACTVNCPLLKERFQYISREYRLKTCICASEAVDEDWWKRWVKTSLGA